MVQLNLVNGDSAALALAASGCCDPDSIIVSPDILSCGPLRDHAKFDNWSLERAEFWRQVLSGRVMPEFEPPERYLNTATNRIGSASELVLWAGNALSDQLFLAAMLRVLEWIDAESAAVSIAQLGNQQPSAAPLAGLAALTPAQIAALPAPLPVTAQNKQALRSFWFATTANEPGRLLEWIETLTHQPVLQRAARLLITRYPATGSGLGFWDECLLQHCSHDWMSLHSLVGNLLRAEAGNLDPVGDIYLDWRLRRLASQRLEKPLLELESAGSVIVGNRIRLTAAGEKVRSGNVNSIDLNGIDDWVGGVHLDSAVGPVWFRDGHDLKCLTFNRT